MSIFSRLKGNGSSLPSRVEPTVKASPSPADYVEPPMYFGIPSGMLGGGTTFSGVVVTPFEAMKSSTVYTCVTSIASSIAKLPIHIQGVDINGGWNNNSKHPLAKLLKRPNSKDISWYQFINNLITHYLLYGNAFIAIIRGNDGRPTDLICVEPGRVSVTELDDGDRSYSATSNQFKGKITSFKNEVGATRRFIQDDMIHLIGTNLGNNIWGQSPITTAAEVIGIDLAIQETRAGAFRNGVSLQYIIKTSGRYKPEQLQALRENLMKGIAGTANTGVGPALPPDVDLIPMNLSPRDLMLPEMGEESTRNVARVFSYPPHKLGLDDKDAATSIEQKERTFISDTLGPITKQFEEIMNDLLLIGEERERFRIKFDYTEATSPVFKDRIDAYGKATSMGIMSPNECRAREGLPGYERGDEIWRPLNTGVGGEHDASDTTAINGENATDDNDESDDQE